MISKNLARCLAKICGDGNIGERYIRYNNTCNVLLEEFKTDMISLFGNLHFTEGQVNSGTAYVILSNKKITQYFKKFHPTFKSFDIYVPSQIMNSKISIKKEFLRAYYDDEGCVGLRLYNNTLEWKRNITLSSNSFRILEEIKKIFFEDFNICSNKIIRNNCNSIYDLSYVLSITGKENIIKFKKNIGFKHPKKLRWLDLMIKSYGATSKKNISLFMKIKKEICSH